MTKLTAETITDDQIRAMRAEYLADRNITGVDTCDVALGRHGASRSPRRVARARTRCAEILNARATRAHSEKKSAKQLDAEIAETLAKPKSDAAREALTRRPARSPRLSPEVRQMFAGMVEDAETDGAENLFLARRDLGYAGDPKEFRFSDIYARQLPSAKYERLVDYIEQYRGHPHDHLGRVLTASEADRLLKEAGKIRDEEIAYLRGRTA